MIKLPQFIISRIEELNEQKEDMFLTQDEREELELLESIPYAVKLQRIMIKKREELDYDLKNFNPLLPDKVFKIATEFKYIQTILEYARK